MDIEKEDVVAELVRALQLEVEQAVGASRDAADYATNEEARAESQWDTQGLEASYLAAGQADQARQWAEALETVQRSREALSAPKAEVTIGALFRCDLNGAAECFFLAPVAGGLVLTVGEVKVTVVTPQSPLAGRLIGKRSGDGFALANGAVGSVVDLA